MHGPVGADVISDNSGTMSGPDRPGEEPKPGHQIVPVIYRQFHRMTVLTDPDPDIRNSVSRPFAIR